MATAPIFNPASFTFTGQNVVDFSDVVMQTIYAKPELNQQLTIVPGIISKQKVGIMGRLSKITKKDAGCGLGQTSPQIPASEKEWDPVQTKIWIQQCWKDLEATFMIYWQRLGKDRPDMIGTAIADFIKTLMVDASIEDLMRIAWFNSTTASAAGSGSGDANLTVGTSLTDYNIIDGIWKQIFAIGAGIKITSAAGGIGTANAAASFALQDSTLTTAGVIADLDAMKYGADTRLRNNPAAMFWVTQSVADKVEQYLRGFTNVEGSYQTLESGVRVAKWNGIPVLPVEFWDRTIRADFSNGTKYDKPHRAILSTKENLMLGLDDSRAPDDFRLFYDEMTETNNFKGGYRVDALVLEDGMLKVAY